MNLHDYLAPRRELVNRALDEALPSEDTKPVNLHKAMRYSVFAGGKRLRPILAMAAAEACGDRNAGLLPLAVSLECIHTYSLIHDDLPAMDDDDTRRGKASCHKAFGEAIAILAGDALLTLAFGALTAPELVRVTTPENLVSVTNRLAEAAGSLRLIAGQASDMECEGKSIGEEEISYIVRNKTGALIAAAAACGAILGGGTERQVAHMSRFGEYLGVAFQIRDDLLDLEGDAEVLGKAVGKDSDRGKATFPGLLGKDKARSMMTELVDEALSELGSFGAGAEPLAMIGAYIVERAN